MSRPSPHRRRSRPAQRGAALVESLVVIPMLVVVTLGLIYIDSAHTARLQVLRQSDEKAWPRSLPGCSGGGGSDSSLSRVDGKLSEAKQLATGRTLREPLETTISTIEETAQKRSKDADDELTGVSVDASSTLSCNEQAKSISRGDVDQVARSFFKRYM